MDTPVTDPTHRAAVLSDWAAALTRGVENALDRADQAVTRAEEQVAVVREHLDRRHERHDR